jgi:hypothetical protein
MNAILPYAIIISGVAFVVVVFFVWQAYAIARWTAEFIWDARRRGSLEDERRIWAGASSGIDGKLIRMFLGRMIARREDGKSENMAGERQNDPGNLKGSQ